MRIRTERFKTLVILDEVHHAGDALSWGEGVREAFEPATRRLALTGTPFRSDINPIPFVTYAPGDDGVPRSVADYTYGYAHALRRPRRPAGAVHGLLRRDAVAHPRRRRDRRPARRAADQGPDLAGAAHRARPGRLVDPVGAGGRRQAAHRGAPPRAGRRRAGDRHRPGLRPRLRRDCWRRSPGRARPWCSPTRRPASKKIAEFSRADDRWMVAVRMVSEGVDVPRLAVGVYATTTSTPLFFAQAVGRFVRARDRGETASVFLPSVPTLLGFASELEVQRDHVLGRRSRRGRHLRRRGRPADGRGQRRARAPPRSWHCLVRGARLRGALRPGALRRRRVRPRRRGARRLGGGDGLPRHPRAARARPGARAAAAAAERAGRSRAAAAPARRRRVAAGRRPTSSSRCCAASSTAWSPPGTTAPGSPTASPTPRCARSAAARPPRSPTPTSCEARIDRVREWAARGETLAEHPLSDRRVAPWRRRPRRRSTGGSGC